MIDKFLGPYELNQIYTGDARELSKMIPDESVDLIFTDPVYDRIEDYEWLAREAVRVLKPDRACLVWFKCSNLQQVVNIMCNNGLNYRWLFEFILIGTPMFYGSIGVKSQKFFWLDKGKSRPSRMVLDVTMINAYLRPIKNNSKVWHDSDRSGAKIKDGLTDWGKDIDGTIRFIEAFARADAIIYDPFTGGGTVPAVCKMLNRNYIAFEIDPVTAELARQRVAQTQPPLPPEMQPRQIELFDD